MYSLLANQIITFSLVNSSKKSNKNPVKPNQVFWLPIWSDNECILGTISTEIMPIAKLNDDSEFDALPRGYPQIVIYLP